MLSFKCADDTWQLNTRFRLSKQAFVLIGYSFYTDRFSTMLFLRSGKFGTKCAKITKGWDTIWIFLNKFLLSRLCINKFILSQKERKWETEKTIMMNHNNKKITFTFVLTHNTTFFPIKKLFSHKLWSATAAFPIN